MKTVMARTDTYQNYLRDLGDLLVDMARQAKVVEQSAPAGQDHAYALGRLIASYEVISLIQEQAETFELSKDELGIAGVDPERDLI